MEQFSNFINWLNGYLWGLPLLILLCGTHLFLTFRTGIIQRKTLLGIKLSLKQDDVAEGDVSQFGALAIALASTVGTGNIVGVGTAITLGGPGAVLWMWLTGVFGIATKYAESLIAILYRVKTKDNTMLGGAMYALERGLNMKWLAVLFAAFAALASFGIGATVQPNAVAVILDKVFDIPSWLSGIAMAGVLAFIILGGVQSISKICIRLVPFMTILYLLGCLIILCLNYDFIFPALEKIITSAFSPQALGGGFVGSTIMIAARYGIARGLFSNESGMGSAPIIAAAAKTKNPVRQALISSTGTFWDTVVICAVTGVVLVSSILASPNPETVISDGSMLTYMAFEQITFIGPIVLAFGLITFGYSTTLGWAYYGERCVEYLFGSKAKLIYRLLYVAAAYVGAVVSLEIVWSLADTIKRFNGNPKFNRSPFVKSNHCQKNKILLNRR
jgi:AGCS family alanine or glycine:cation symporter